MDSMLEAAGNLKPRAPDQVVGMILKGYITFCNLMRTCSMYNYKLLNVKVGSPILLQLQNVLLGLAVVNSDLCALCAKEVGGHQSFFEFLGPLWKNSSLWMACSNVLKIIELEDSPHDSFILELLK